MRQAEMNSVVLGGADRLAGILAPVGVEEFLTDHWAERPLYVAGRRDRFSDLFSWEALEELLASGGLPPEYLAIVGAGGVAVPESAFVEEVLKCRVGRPARVLVPDRVWALFADRRSLLVKYIDRRIPAIRRMVDELCAELGELVTGNIYCSSDGQSAIPPHVDSHEVFVLGLEGDKEWTLLPAGEPPLRVTVRPGDVLYVPMGCRHVAHAANGPSMHLTLGIHRRTGKDLLDWLLRRCTEVPAIRRNLPLGFRADRPAAYAEEALRRGADEARAALSSLVDDPETLTEFVYDLVRAQAVRAAPPWPDGWSDARLGADTLVHCTGAHRSVFRDGRGGETMLAVAGYEYAVAAEVAPALNWLFRVRRASLAAIAAEAGEIPFEVVAGVVGALVRDGVVAVGDGAAGRGR